MSVFVSVNLADPPQNGQANNSLKRDVTGLTVGEVCSGCGISFSLSGGFFGSRHAA